MKRIMLISLIFHAQLFCGSDEEKPLIPSTEKTVQVQRSDEQKQFISSTEKTVPAERISTTKFHAAITSNNKEFFRKNFPQLQPKSDMDRIGLKSAAEANVTSKQVLVAHVSNSIIFKKKKSLRAQKELAHALAIQEMIATLSRPEDKTPNSLNAVEVG